jgi:DNA polymerase-3 subunit epsilon
VIFFFDTETTGKADFRAPAGAKHQPHIVQIAGLLIDECDWSERGSFSYVIKPDGYDIPSEASNIHGITTEMAAKYGVSVHVALSAFDEFKRLSALRVAHNIAFDDLVVSAAFQRATQCVGTLVGYDSFCTMLAMTPICKFPGNYGDYKWPKLQEAYRHAFGTEFQGAHDALADVRACSEVYRWMRDNRIGGAK